ncbi:suppressor of IKBKE 1 [Latimeria chalumnae]|uniref:suppressor of IKBKE 1 n=1 Tax=Latimeria chalumnae TaxID=7897 RepID=UPI00313AA13E
MTCTIDKILADAKTLLERLKDHDNAAESLIEQSTTLSKRVEDMKEAGTALPEKYQEDAAELKDLSKYKPHILLCQENSQIRELQQENRELWLSLEEHQYALELIMSKYRRQMLQLMMAKKKIETDSVLEMQQEHSKEIPSKLDRICEMGEVMRVAVHLDDQQFLNLQEKLAQLELENKELKELLSISKGPADVNKEETTENKSQLQN